MENKNLVYAVRMNADQKKIIAVQTAKPDAISIDKMKSLISIEGFKYYVVIENKEIFFEFNDETGEIEVPTQEQINKIEKF